MTDESKDERGHRARRLRSTWRDGERAAGAGDHAEAPEAQRDRHVEALGSNDRLREEAPDDLETRRGADALEREIKRTRQREG